MPVSTPVSVYGESLFNCTGWLLLSFFEVIAGKLNASYTSESRTSTLISHVESQWPQSCKLPNRSSMESTQATSDGDAFIALKRRRESAKSISMHHRKDGLLINRLA